MQHAKLLRSTGARRSRKLPFQRDKRTLTGGKLRTIYLFEASSQGSERDSSANAPHPHIPLPTESEGSFEFEPLHSLGAIHDSGHLQLTYAE
jgi:hypothetical protein